MNNERHRFIASQKNFRHFLKKQYLCFYSLIVQGFMMEMKKSPRTPHAASAQKAASLILHLADEGKGVWQCGSNQSSCKSTCFFLCCPPQTPLWMGSWGLMQIGAQSMGSGTKLADCLGLNSDGPSDFLSAPI